MNKKKILGYVYPFIILVFMLTVYYCLIVNLIFLNRANMFGNTVYLTLTVVFLVVFHVLLGIVVYCYLYCMFSNPGEPPQFWVS